MNEAYSSCTHQDASTWNVYQIPHFPVCFTLELQKQVDYKFTNKLYTKGNILHHLYVERIHRGSSTKNNCQLFFVLTELNYFSVIWFLEPLSKHSTGCFCNVQKKQCFCMYGFSMFLDFFLPLLLSFALYAIFVIGNVLLQRVTNASYS